jgi:hypothetical protein
MQFATIPNLPTADNPKLNKAHDKLQALLGALREKEVPDEIVQQINELFISLEKYTRISF